MDTESKPMDGWNDLPWKQFERQGFKLQKRMYRASKRGDMKTVHKLQRLLMNSWSAKGLAVRRLTQDNQGKKTAGIDGVKSLSPSHRLALVSILKLSPQTRPVRRVWIPKPGTQEKRGLGIPRVRSYCPPYEKRSGLPCPRGSDQPTHGDSTVAYFPCVDQHSAVSNGAALACAGR
jgi:hypothetical protein